METTHDMSMGEVIVIVIRAEPEWVAPLINELTTEIGKYDIRALDAVGITVTLESGINVHIAIKMSGQTSRGEGQVTRRLAETRKTITQGRLKKRRVGM